jgi:N-acetylglutamate synthase-like GNAT family acetyltransferase
MKIRVATLADVPRMLEMGARFLEGSRYRRFLNLNPQQQTQLVTELVQQDTANVFIAEQDATVVGMFGLTLSTNPFDGVRTAMEMFWWVEPHHRGSTGLRLLRTAEAWAKAAGAERLYMVVPTSDVGSLLKRLGYVYVESIYQRLL